LQKSGVWKELTRPCVAGLLAGLSVFLLPLLVVEERQAAQQEPQLLPSPPARQEQEQPRGTRDGAQKVRILTEGGTVEEMTLEEYLWRVVAAEMPASFEVEALRAQAVCARTYTLWKMEADRHDGADLCDDSACCQAYTTREEAAARWGDLNQLYTRRIAAAVEDTDGWILTYDGAPIQAVFFSSSTASTEDARQVWGNGLPYLVSVATPEGEEVPNYRSRVELTAEQVRALAADSGLGAGLSGDPAGWITQVQYNASGRVESLELGGVSLSGGAARSLFGLRSACFTVEERDGVFSFSVVGYGHGVGMSQYGANAMAKQGSTWQEIVRHYYTGITVEQRAQTE